MNHFALALTFIIMAYLVYDINSLSKFEIFTFILLLVTSITFTFRYYDIGGLLIITCIVCVIGMLYNFINQYKKLKTTEDD